ncbi:SH3 domain-containing protein [Streptomyces sp. NPDC127108]|uniref:SH3 domain-containing protein n=1 Tax=Streptomyces sp. NPDC127108 TaxID=3345361 RepID=UPI00363C393F
MASKTVSRVIFAVAVALGFGMVGVSAASAAPPPAAPPPSASAAKAPSMPIPGPGGVQAYAAGSDGRLTYGEVAAATVNGLRVRGGPGIGYVVLGLLGKGDKVKLIGAKQDRRGQIWHRVVLRGGSDYGLPNGYVGWVTASYLY